MNDETIRHELRRVGLRYRSLLRWTGLLICWTVFALGGLALLAWARGAGHTIPGIALLLLIALPLLAIPVILAALRRTRDPLWIARRIEQKFPELDTRLLAALEQKPDEKSNKLGYLQKTVIDETLVHAYTNHWDKLVSPAKLRLAKLAQFAMLLVFMFVLGVLTLDMSRRATKAGGWWLGGVATKFEIQVEPQDTSIERNTSLIVLARFNGSELPTDVQLLSREADGPIQQIPMSKSLNDPVFASRVQSVKRDMSYAVRYGDAETKWYKVGVFDFPQLKQADANLKFPQYTGLSDKKIEDTRSVTAVEGTKATFTLRLNKPVQNAQLVPKPTSQPSEAAPVKLTADPNDPSIYTVAFDMKQSQRFQLDLTDDQGRKPKEASELVLNVTPNQAPTVQLTWPGRDVDASPLQEINFKARVWDDFGVKRVGMSYTMAGKPPQDVILAENVPAKEKRDVVQLVSMEKLSAEPDQLLSYYFWAEDSAADGTTRRTAGDMFFAEVRPFEEIFRQGQQPAGGEQQQQQQQQGNQNAQQAEDLAELQKDIISATWKIMRRETLAKPTAQFVPDVKSINESQASAKQQATALGERLQDARSKQFLESVLKHMDDAVKQLDKASGGPAIDAMAPALSAEQAAYQDLLKLRAREHEVVRGNRGQRGNSSSASSRRQRQMNQLDLADQDNRYETQRAAQQQDQDPQQRETRQVLSRLRELAQRQEDLNRQMRELQSALQQARDQEQREEIQRQLARLRDQQQQQLRDTDELRDRMDQPQNQERMADSRQQLEQTRENVRRAGEELDQQNVANASAAGARASEQLNNLRDDFRKTASGQFGEAMQQMRDQARQLDQNEQQLSQRLSDLNNPTTQRTLRDAGERQQIVDGFNNQRQQLDKLMDNMRRTIEDAETPEPLLSKQLYDTVRQAVQQNPEQTLDATRQLLDRGFVDEARQAEGQAKKTITSMRQGVEKAAESVLGDQTEALRRARNELDNLADQLDREIQRNAPQASAAGRRGQPTTRQGGAGQQQMAGNNPDGQNPGDQANQANDQQANAQGADGQQQGADQQQPGAQQGNRAGQQARGGQRDGRGGQRGQQPGGQQGDQAQAGGQRGNRAGGQQGQGQGDQQQDGQNPQLADAGQQGQGQRGGRQGQGRGGQQPGGDQPGNRAGGLRGQPQRGNGRGNANADANNANPNADPELARAFGGGNRQGGGLNQPGGGPDQRGPLTGEGFRDWTDRLRDVEEMVDDPQLRAQAAQIRDRARAVRSDMTRHSLPPNWDMVMDMISKPLVDLRDSVNQELMRRESSQALVPVDREPVPPEYAEQVRRYYERLGSGK